MIHRKIPYSPYDHITIKSQHFYSQSFAFESELDIQLHY